ncbi:hypothetical protein TeGR_g2068, partial [Tetraparma gracilis]
YSFKLAKSLVKQLDGCAKRGEIDEQTVKDSLRPAFFKIIDFEKKIQEEKENASSREECLEWHHMPKRTEV